MFPSPFPEHIGFVIREDSEIDEAALPAEELALLKDMGSAKRRREFVLGRNAAKGALSKIGYNSNTALLIGSQREPLWPADITGSITHCHEFAIAVCAWKKDVRSLGIDLESITRPLRYPVDKLVCVGEELDWIQTLPELKNLRTLLLFSAKESVYKALYPLVQRFINFHDVMLRWDEARSGFVATLRNTLSQDFTAGAHIFVRVQIDEAYVLSSILLEA